MTKEPKVTGIFTFNPLSALHSFAIIPHFPTPRRDYRKSKLNRNIFIRENILLEKKYSTPSQPLYCQITPTQSGLSSMPQNLHVVATHFILS